MRALSIASRHLNEDDASPNASIEHCRVLSAKSSWTRDSDVDFLGRARGAIVVRQKTGRFPELKTSYTASPTKTAILDAEDSLVGGGEASVEIENVRHKIAFTMTNGSSS